jgi:dipeptidyl aminopeptidase/acylaminoacyl peptidase
MSEMVSIRFRARDGVLIGGYITLPAGKGRSNLPMIVMPHNRTNGRQAWGFDPYVQFLASHGYAVLEVDYRGSAGYGEPYRTAANGQAVQMAVRDCADGVQWAIKQKLADPSRVAVFGQGSLSGAYAYMSLVSEPGLYRCGLVGAGTTDWSRIFDRSRIMPDDYAVWLEKYGNPEDSTDAEKLKEVTPLLHAGKIKVPVLIMHDKLNFKQDWLYNQSRDMADALEKAGTPVVFSDRYFEKYGYLTLAKYMNDTLAFLAEHMPADG